MFFCFCDRESKEGDIECRYATKEETDKEPLGRTTIVDEALVLEQKKPNSDSRDKETGKDATDAQKDVATAARNLTLSSQTSNTSATDNSSVLSSVNNASKVETTNATADTCSNATCQSHLANSGVLWVCSRILDCWSYGYNSVNKLLKSGKCPMPWLHSSRIHCNNGKSTNTRGCWGAVGTWDSGFSHLQDVLAVQTLNSRAAPLKVSYILLQPTQRQQNAHLTDRRNMQAMLKSGFLGF